MTQQQHFEGLTSQMKQILLKKGGDYANDEDVLVVFKQAGAIWGLSPETIAGIMATIKIIRLANLMTDSKEPNNESLADNRLDLTNYSILMDMAAKDSNTKNSSVYLDGRVILNQIDAMFNRPVTARDIFPDKSKI